MTEEMKRKVTNYSAAWIRSIAEIRGRDPLQAEMAVTESKSFTSTNALENRLIDFEVKDIDSLLNQLNGKRVKLSSGQEVTINTTGYTLATNTMNFVERFLHAISDPNIAYILLSLATIGLITEISNPGLIIPGIAGGICLLFSLYSLGTLNAYWAGLLLILLAFGLFIAEIFTPAFGILTAGGLISLIIGSFILFVNNPPEMAINPILIVIISILLASFIIFMVGAVVKGQKRKIYTGTEGLLGKLAIVQTKLNPKGSVLVEGERWAATLDEGSAEVGDDVEIIKVEGLKLLVTTKKKHKEG